MDNSNSYTILSLNLTKKNCSWLYSYVQNKF